MKKNLTPLQSAMLRRIATDECTILNGAEPETPDDTRTWAENVIQTQADKGTFTSLLNAGLVRHEGRGQYAVVRLTDAGFAAYKDLHAVGLSASADSDPGQDEPSICPS